MFIMCEWKNLKTTLDPNPLAFVKGMAELFVTQPFSLFVTNSGPDLSRGYHLHAQLASSRSVASCSKNLSAKVTCKASAHEPIARVCGDILAPSDMRALSRNFHSTYFSNGEERYRLLLFILEGELCQRTITCFFFYILRPWKQWNGRRFIILTKMVECWIINTSVLLDIYVLGFSLFICNTFAEVQ